MTLCFLMIFGKMTLASQNNPVKLTDTTTPWHINAKKITYNQKTKIYTAIGDVKIYQNEKSLTAETVVFNHLTMQVVSTGNVLLSAGSDTLTGDKININLDSGVGEITNGTIFLEKKHFFIRGDRILKTDENTYMIHKGSLTSCNGEVPDWQITGQDLNVTIEEYGTLKHGALWAKNIPVFYVPYLIFPVKLKRQSGLLAPQIAYSDRNGFEFIQPYFWAINPFSDATVYFHHIHQRGEMIGGEYRYALKDDSKGTFMFDSLNDRKTDDGSGDSSNHWGYTDDQTLRPNSDRYWFRMKLDQLLPSRIKAKLDLDVVSDQDYLREFSDGYTGYNESNKYFIKEFGRDIDDDDDPVRENSFTLSKYWTLYTFNAELLWYDNVVNRRQEDTDSTLQQLPSITFDALKQPLPGGLFYTKLDTEYTNFYKRDGITGQRMDLHPRIFLPLRYKNYFTLEPSAGYRQTVWYLDRGEPEVTGLDEYAYQHREIYDLKADLTTDIFRVVSIRGQSIDKVKHTITPKLEYSYIPDVDQSDYPGFDDTDDIDAENLITFSLTNLLISREQMPHSLSSATQKTTDISSNDYRYNQFFRFMIEQSYDFLEENTSDQNAFSPLYTELDVTPVNFLTFHAESEWSHDKGHFLTQNVYCKFYHRRRSHLLIEHRYTRDKSQSVNIDIAGAVTNSIYVFGNYEKNLETHKNIEIVAGCRYQSQCWSAEFSFKEKDNDEKIACMVNLYGLGEVGNRL